jgi:hypothetical protein
MSRTRVLFAMLLTLTLAGGILGTSLRVQAQEATPVVDLSVTPPAQPGGTLPGIRRSSSSRWPAVWPTR